MSYCVNCGVELDASQKSCPLCHVPVVNPASPWREPVAGPYPKRVEHLLDAIDHRYGALLATIVLSIPVMCSILIDILVTRDISWSGYVVGGCICIFVWVLLPLIVKRPNAYLHILYDAAALIFYLAAIFYVNGIMRPFLTLALPLALALTAAVYAAAPVIRAKRLKDRLYKPAIISALLGALLVVMELIIDVHVNGVFEPAWSLIAAAPCIVFCALLMLLEGKDGAKDRIVRRLFM